MKNMDIFWNTQSYWQDLDKAKICVSCVMYFLNLGKKWNHSYFRHNFNRVQQIIIISGTIHLDNLQ